MHKLGLAGVHARKERACLSLSLYLSISLSLSLALSLSLSLSYSIFVSISLSLSLFLPLSLCRRGRAWGWLLGLALAVGWALPLGVGSAGKADPGSGSAGSGWAYSVTLSAYCQYICVISAQELKGGRAPARQAYGKWVRSMPEPTWRELHGQSAKAKAKPPWWTKQVPYNPPGTCKEILPRLRDLGGSYPQLVATCATAAAARKRLS